MRWYQLPVTYFIVVRARIWRQLAHQVALFICHAVMCLGRDRVRQCVIPGLTGDEVEHGVAPSWV